MLGGCWTLRDISLDAPVPWVAAKGVERSAESARRAACRCHRGWRAVHMVTGSAAGVHERRTLVTLRVSWSAPGARVTRGT